MSLASPRQRVSPDMRTDYHAEIDRLTAALGEMCAVAAHAMECATNALVRADREAAQRCRAEAARLSQLHHRVDEQAFAILALHAPVAHDLRVVMSAFPISADAHRMGGLSVNIAKVNRSREAVPTPPTALTVFAEMGRHAVALAHSAQSAVLVNDLAAAQRITDGDEVMNQLHRRLFGMALGDRWEHGPRAAANVMLLGRFYERFADHAVGIARRVVFQASGRLPHISMSPI
ncbi:phosphate signaling complex protein PhoU [Mycolicibacterium sp. Y3]